ncbi:hypothetical protein LINPERPRIM_LOCUS12497 [Linum perenne]
MVRLLRVSITTNRDILRMTTPQHIIYESLFHFPMRLDFNTFNNWSSLKNAVGSMSNRM